MKWVQTSVNGHQEMVWCIRVISASGVGYVHLASMGQKWIQRGQFSSVERKKVADMLRNLRRQLRDFAKNAA